MLCDECNQREALFSFTQIVGEKKNVKNLCFECAQKQGFENPLMDLSKVLGKLLVNMLDQHLHSKKASRSEKDSDVLCCDKCQLNWADFKENGLLGCPHCYESFKDKLKILLRRVHGNNQHVGQKLPSASKITESNDDILYTLEKKLQNAVKLEKFEEAAKIRDQIREFKVK